jgi:SAM-dependent methyltransferase
MGMKESERGLRPWIGELLSQWRGGGGKGPLTPKELQRASTGLLSLQRGLTGTRTLAGNGYMDDSSFLGSYLLYYWPVSYLQSSLALSSDFDVIRSFRAKESVRILDLGSGPGAVSCALADLLGKTPLSITLVDSSSKAMRLAERLLKTKGIQAESHQTQLESDDLSFLSGSYDCILLSHTLNELWIGDTDAIGKRASLVEKVASFLSPSGILLLMEPALLETSRNLLAVRDRLVSSGFTILSPCLGDCPCGALCAGPSHTCHAEITWKPGEPMASLAAKAGLDRASVKMTFFVMKKGTTETKAKEQTALIVSDCMLNKAGRIRFLCCDGQKRFSISAKTDAPAAVTSRFASMRRYDLISYSGLEKRGEGDEQSYGIGRQSTIRLISHMAEKPIGT